MHLKSVTYICISEEDLLKPLVTPNYTITKFNIMSGFYLKIWKTVILDLTAESDKFLKRFLL